MNLAEPFTSDRIGRRIGAAIFGLIALSGAVGCSLSDSTDTAPATTTEVPAGPSTEAPVADGSTPPESEETVTEASAQGTLPVGFRSFDLTDESRDTPANGDAPATDGRVLPTLAYYPADGEAGPDAGSPEAAVADAEFRSGRYPVIVFSHGLTGRATFYQGELAALASAGYVVLATDYPLSNFDAPGKPTAADVGNQPGDASYLLDVFLDDEADAPIAAVGEHIDAERIGAVGHSLGAMTSLGLGYSECCIDDRIDAVAAWAGAFLPLMGEDNPTPDITDRPLLLIHGDDDETVPFAASASAFDAAESPRWLITLPGGAHIAPFVAPGGGPVAQVVTTATIDFFDAQVKGDPTGIDRMEQVVANAGADQATIESAGV